MKSNSLLVSEHFVLLYNEKTRLQQLIEYLICFGWIFVLPDLQSKVICDKITHYDYSLYLKLFLEDFSGHISWTSAFHVIKMEFPCSQKCKIKKQSANP